MTHSFSDTTKRIVDATLALILIVLVSPLLLIVAVTVCLTSPGPLFYRQKRVGRDGHLFEICKFRTMQHNADKLGPSVTSADDCRITPIGRLLRNSKMDELPQLFNVLRGDMSLVGPRPQVPRFVEHFDPDLRTIVLRVRPGITGPTALCFRHEESLLADKADRESYYIQHILPTKLAMDVQYVQTRSLRRDLGILSQTVYLFTLAPVRRLALVKVKRRGARGAAATRDRAAGRKARAHEETRASRVSR